MANRQLIGLAVTIYVASGACAERTMDFTSNAAGAAGAVGATIGSESPTEILQAIAGATGEQMSPVKAAESGSGGTVSFTSATPVAAGGGSMGQSSYATPGSGSGGSMGQSSYATPGSGSGGSMGQSTYATPGSGSTAGFTSATPFTNPGGGTAAQGGAAQTRNADETTCVGTKSSDAQLQSIRFRACSGIRVEYETPEAVPCEFALPNFTSPESTVNPSEVWIFASGAQGLLRLLHLANPSDCALSTQGGFYLDDNMNPTRVTLCACTCSAVQDLSAYGSLEMIVGCGD